MDQVKRLKRVGKKGGVPLEQDCFPPKVGPKMANYEVEDCPWNVQTLEADAGLYKTALWSSSDNPQLKVRNKHISHWEASNRESMSVASYTESFLWAGQERLKQVVSNLDNRRFSEDPTLSLEHIEDSMNPWSSCSQQQ